MILGTRLAFLLLLLAAPAALAQPVGSCALGTDSAELDVNGVRARLYNKGNLFFDGGDPNYEVPRGSGINAIFAATVWIGGMVEGDVRIAAATYAQGGQDYELYPGPLDAEGRPPADCTPYDRIWKVSRSDLARYEETGVATDDLTEWPAHLGAPFFDVDGDGDYDLAIGDRPQIWGDQTAWWVMNDAAGPHLTTRSEPMGIETRVTAFAAASPEPALLYTTFYRFEITYRGTASMDSTYFGLHVDTDLGNYLDDYVGSDSLLGLGFTYNADNDDETSSGYGTAPPALGLTFVEGPVLLPNGRDDDRDGAVDEPGERGRMTSSTWTDDDPHFGVGYFDDSYYPHLRCRWGDGEPWTVGGYGYGGTEPTCWVHPGDVYPTPEYWSEPCPTSGCGAPLPPSDRRFVSATGPFRMEPGETEEIVFAFVWARGQDHLDSVRELKAATEYVQRAYALGRLDPVAPPPPEPQPGPEAFAFGVWPTPFRDQTAVRLAVPEGAPPVRVAVIDGLGREVAVLAEGALSPGVHALALDGRSLPAGVYAVRLDVQGQTRTLLVTHVE